MQRNHKSKKRTIVVANRLPVSISRRKDGLKIQQSPGGLAAGLRLLQEQADVTFIGWPGCWPSSDSERREIEKILIDEHQSHPVFIHPSEVSKYYYGFSNRTLWPLFHYFPSYCSYDPSEWESYRRVNQAFLQAILESADSSDVFWIHDYHLMLLPSLLRKSRPQSSIGYFLHIPFPSSEIFRQLPWRKEFLEGVLGADLIGFHTYEYARHFLSSVLRILGHEHEFGFINIDNRTVKVENFPMGIDIKHIERLLDKPSIKKEIVNFRQDFEMKERKILLSVDRLDYTKGIPNRLEGLELFLEKYPEWHNRFIYIMLCVPSRTKVEQYSLLKEEIDRLVGRINGRFGNPGWIPIHYLYRSLPFEKLLPLYAAADVALVSPFRDGMNLVAKEYVAAKTDNRGVLVLSETAGAAFELGEAMQINVNNKVDLAFALNQALMMKPEEQETRIKAMRTRLKEFDVYRWVDTFMKSIIEVKKIQAQREHRQLRSKWKTKLFNDYKKAKKRLLLLDYDGTLVPYVKEPDQAKPDLGLIRILKMLTLTAKNTLVVISGRDRSFMDRWLGEIPCGLVAEHGAWIRESLQDVWHGFNGLSVGWKKRLRPILQDYVVRVPGSLIEEKEYGIAWHYRKADPELGPIRAGELVDYLTDFLASKDLHVFHGNKVVEVRNSEINKGRGIAHWLADKKWDFILALGDDWTDEDLFKVLPKTAYSIKVTYGPTEAKYYLDAPQSARDLLLELAKI
jgi:trehalose 6-phosphate synthase/phosphatase